MITYQHPRALPRSDAWSLRINDTAVEVLRSDLADFAICALPEGTPGSVRIQSTERIVRKASIHPRRLGIEPVIEANEAVSFHLRAATNLLIQSPGLPDLYLFIHDKAEELPSGGNVLRIPSGTTVESAVFDFEGIDHLHIEGGAVLKGRIVVRNRPHGIRITGHGIFDGSFYLRNRDGFIPSIVLDRCPGSEIEDITMINPCGWMLLLGVSNNTTVRRLKQLGRVISSDGIDIVGSSHIRIEDCFLSNNDDCIVIKAFNVGSNNLDATQVDGRESVEDVIARNCVLVNGPAGNAMEIGHELSVDSVRDVRFENMDVVSVHGHGAVFSLHNNDRALVERIVFDTIRIEHCYDKFIDFRISRSRYSTDHERGRIRNVLLRNIDWDKNTFNDGYTVSMIGGWGPDNRIEDVRIENLRVNGTPIQSPDDLEITTRYADPPIVT